MGAATTTVPLHFVHNLFHGLTISVAQKKKSLREVGIPCFLLEASNGRVTIEQFANLFRYLAKQYDDETPGFFSRPLRGGTLKYLCLSLLDAPSLQVALHRYSQFFRVLLDDIAYVLEVNETTASLIFIERRPLKGDRVLVHELMLKLVHGIASWLIAEKIPPLKISCAYAQPQHSPDYLYFYPGTVVFEQTYTALYFDKKYLRMPIQQTKKQLNSFLQQAPKDWIYVSFSESLLAHKIKDFLSKDAQTGAKIDQVAAALHLSVRTLSRRLTAEGTSFQSIKDEVRRDLAIQYLTSGKQSLDILANQLGFEDSSSFSRAFRSWTGSPPSNYRQVVQG